MINYIQVNRNIGVCKISLLPYYGNQKATHKSNDLMEKNSEIFDINEILNFLIPITFRIIDQYQCKFPSLTVKFKSTKYKHGSFC